MNTDCHQILAELHQALCALRKHEMTIEVFCRLWRSQHGLLGELPPRYGQVMEDLLGRLEASSLFTEESCSFSQEDLHAGLNSWLDKAATLLQARRTTQ